MGLTPKKRKPFVKLGWDNLDEKLKANIDNNENDDAPTATIKLSDYKMSKEDILNELAKNGYSVIDNSDGYLTIS